MRLNAMLIQHKKNELKKMLKDSTLSADEKLKISTKIFQELKNQ